MGIIGIDIKSISAVNTSGIKKKITVSMKPEITQISAIKGNVLGTTDLVSIRFKYSINYSPDAGKIEIEGAIIYKPRDQALILKQWKTKKMDDRDVLILMNAIYQECTIKSLTLAHEVKLPTPLKLPKFVSK